MKKTLLISLFILAPLFLFSDDSATGGPMAPSAPAAQSDPSSGPAQASPLSPSEKASEELAFLASHLGMSLSEVVERAGLPVEMYTLRGPSAGQDSVVFYYADRISLYWTESHVWQVRLDSEYSSGDVALKMGMPRSEVTALLGIPDLEEPDYIIYTLPQRVYPVAAALYFDNNRLKDLYVYRSDF